MISGLTVLTPIICIIYRIYYFLRYGINPTITLESSIPFSVNYYFEWKGVQYIYDLFVSLPLELAAIIIFLIVILVKWKTDPLWE